MKNKWFRIVVCLGAAVFILVLGVSGALSKNYAAETYNKDRYYENYDEDSYKEETYNKDYNKYSYYKGSYYNDYYKDYCYRAYKYVFNYIINLLERFPLLENIFVNSLCLD